MKVYSIVLAAVASLGAQAVTIEGETTLGEAKAELEGSMLRVTTGRVAREWKIGADGLETVALVDERTGYSFPVVSRGRCDWRLPSAGSTKCGAPAFKSRIDDDDGFSSKHLEIVATFTYPEQRIEAQYVIWAFPAAAGIRTQLRLKALDGYTPAKDKGADIVYKDCAGTLLKPGAIADALPIDFSKPNSRLYWGYMNDPGNRTTASKPMLKEERVKGWPLFIDEAIDWASGEAVSFEVTGGSRLSRPLGGVAIVKESAKAVNNPAYLTGAFFSGKRGVEVSGLGLAPDEIVPDRFRDCWATWTLVYDGTEDGLQTSLKTFDAARYPVDVKRDMFIISNTWGPANPNAFQYAKEDFVLKEIAAGGELGIDVVQIDDGWQKGGHLNKATAFLPNYKDGWKNIKAAAEAAGVRMGLWCAIRGSKLEELEKCVDDLGFVSWKFDFDRLASRSDYEARRDTYRALMKHAPGRTQMTLCPEYDDPRYGWYYSREYGSIFFQNIQEAKPAHLTLVPYQVLKQNWLMAKYFPSNKLQVMLQNPKRANKSQSDAYLHSHAYCFAMGIPFVPNFFQSAQFLDKEGKAELKTLIAEYKKVREDIFTSITYPVGEEPDNESWSGFQMASTKRNGGHMLLFRELHNGEATKRVALKGLAGKRIKLTEIPLRGRVAPVATETTVAQDGTAEFTIPAPADFRLYRYDVAND